MKSLFVFNWLQIMDGFIIERHDSMTQQFHVGFRRFALNLNVHNVVQYGRFNPYAMTAKNK
ncbi:hypothetical protein CP97_00210 [Aurantiacibacter atlanticus]|uniref:Uncharacterized protein n=1 Tax=Aurantiacibacter atlanticus TaxID=1648404 RepID=A0A0H4V884_9SPHN|nr:hypothetical protein CP97_00210 [Aurantiacibacter atlanticus]